MNISLRNKITSEEKHKTRDLLLKMDINGLMHACLLVLPSNVLMSPTDLNGLIFCLYFYLGLTENMHMFTAKVCNCTNIHLRKENLTIRRRVNRT